MSDTHSQDVTTNMLALNKEPEMADSFSQLETRVARLETQMEHMGSIVSRILEELKDLRTSIEHVNERISMLQVTMSEKFGEIKVWALTLGVGLGFGILTVIARAFHWI